MKWGMFETDKLVSKDYVVNTDHVIENAVNQ